jgi:hypothetical protein
MNTMTFYLLALLGYIFANFIFKKIFYNGKLNEDNWLVFNLSPFAETMLTTLYLSVGVYEIVILSTTLPIWYEWIFPIFWIFWFSIKGFLVFLTRNNFIKIKGKIIEYNTTNGSGSFKTETYEFADHLLVLRSIDNKKVPPLILDLKDLNLIGFKSSIKKHLEKSELKKYNIQ